MVRLSRRGIAFYADLTKVIILVRSRTWKIIFEFTGGI